MVVLVGLYLFAAAPAQPAVSEAQIKAAYLYKLASFVRWPPAAFGDQAAPLRICVSGRDDVFDVVAALTHGQFASGHALVAETIDAAHPDAVGRCQILFLGRGQAAARALMAQAGTKPVLTVSDRSAGTRGGIVEFVLVGGTIRFSVNRHAAEARQLVVSSKLLAVAVSVEP